MRKIGNLPVSAETENYLNHRQQMDKYYEAYLNKQQQQNYAQLEKELYKKLDLLLDNLIK